MATADQRDEPERIDGLYPEHVRRIAVVMREHYPKVLAANRFFEEETGLHNEVGANNLNDALSHLGTLMEAAPRMTLTEQAHEVHDFEGHLRRGMMESYELVFRMRMGQVAKLWNEHLKVARPLIEEGKLHGAPTAEELDRLRRRCKNLLDDGRAAKRGHDWEQWDKGTEALAEACRTASELFTALDQGIAAAEARRSNWRGLRIGVASTVVVGLICLPLGWWLNTLLSQDSVSVPYVTNTSLVAASMKLANHDLHVAVVNGTTASSQCLVISQVPKAGQSVDKGSRVSLRARCP